MDFDSTDSSSGSSSSSDDAEIFVNLIYNEIYRSKTKNENFVDVTVAQYTEKDFFEHFRVSRGLVHSLAQQYEMSEFYPSQDTGHLRINPEKCILIFLWYAGHEAASFRDVGDRFDISISTLHEVIKKVSLFLSNLSSTNVTWPTEEEKVEILEDFANMGFENVLGCIDGSHIRIDTPGDDPESYFNRKKYYSVHIQAVCDSRRKIRDVFIGFPGSVHDARVFANSTLSNTLEQKCGDNCILGDSAYPCLRNLLTPYKNTGNLTEIEIHYNKMLSKSRILIEHTFGILKQKFRQLYHLKLRGIETICHFIRACCVLHNMSLENDGLFEELQEGAANIQANVNEHEDNPIGLHYRNYVASVLYHAR